MGRAARLRRHELRVAILTGTRDLNASLSPLSRRRKHGIEQEDSWNEHSADIAPVDLVGSVRDHLAMIRRRIGVHVPAFDTEAVIEFFDRDRFCLVGVFF